MDAAVNAIWSGVCGSVVFTSDAQKRGQMPDLVANSPTLRVVSGAVAVAGYIGASVVSERNCQLSTTRFSLLLGALSAAHLASMLLPVGSLNNGQSAIDGYRFLGYRLLLLPALNGALLCMTWDWSNRADVKSADWGELNNLQGLFTHPDTHLPLWMGVLVGVRFMAFPLATFVVQLRGGGA